MSSFSRYLPTPVIHFGQKSPSNTQKTISRNPEFVFPEKKMEANFQEGYERWFDFSRILLPAHFCYEQNRQRSAVDVGCPPLIPAVPVLNSSSCYTDVRKRRREILDEQENDSNDTGDQPPKEEKIKREDDDEEEEEDGRTGKRKLILKLIQDQNNSQVRQWRPVKDNRETSSSIGEESKSGDVNKTDKPELYREGKMGTTKLEEYLEKRRKNNASAKKSREARRMRELQTQIHAAYLEDENSKLRTIVGALRKENSHLRDLLIV